MPLITSHHDTHKKVDFSFIITCFVWDILAVSLSPKLGLWLNFFFSLFTYEWHRGLVFHSLRFIGLLLLPLSHGESQSLKIFSLLSRNKGRKSNQTHSKQPKDLMWPARKSCDHFPQLYWWGESIKCEENQVLRPGWWTGSTRMRGKLFRHTKLLTWGVSGPLQG